MKDGKLMVKILKIGGSILTDKTRAESPKIKVIERIATEIAGCPEGLILIHGAGSFGHIQAKRYGLKDKFDPKGILETHRSVVRLNDLVVEHLDNAGLHPVPVHPFGNTILKSGRVELMETKPITEMLKRGLIPVLHGDVAMDTSKGVEIVSGDQLVAHLAKLLGPELVALGTAADGVIFDGKVLKTVTKETLPKIEPQLGGSSGVDVTGGMRGKLLELLGLADRGIASIIFNAGKAGLIEKVLRCEKVGTCVEGPAEASEASR